MYRSSRYPETKGYRPSLDGPEGVLGLKTEVSPGEGVPFPYPMGKSRCQKSDGFFLRGDGPDGAVWFPLTCGRWDCPAPSCGGLKRLAAAELFTGGIRRAHLRGERVRFITLTAPGKGMTMAAVYTGLKRVMATLRKTGEVSAYAGVVELQHRGAPHLHLVATGEYIHQSRLSAIARGRSGSKGRFGRVAWIESVTPTAREGAVELAGYFTKDLAEVGGELAGYVTKARAEQMRQMGAKGQRVRPIRNSRNWYPGGMAAARDAVVARWFPDASPGTDAVTNWQMFQLVPNTGELRFIRALGETSGDVLPFPLRDAVTPSVAV